MTLTRFSAFVSHRRGTRLAGSLLLAGGLVVGCGDDTDPASAKYVGEAGLGSEVEPVDGGVIDGASALSDAQLPSDTVQLRVFHGIVNLGPVRLCHDPRYLYDPVRHEAQPGSEPGRPLVIVSDDAGLADLGVATAYVPMDALETGAITLHRVAVPPVTDAGAALDAALQGDASLSDAAGPDAAHPCDPASLAAALPLPTDVRWLDPAWDAGPVDAGADGGIALIPTASAGDKLTLFGSGLTLEPDALTALQREVEQSYLKANPGASMEQATTEWRRQRAQLESAIGPRFLLARAAPSRSAQRFSLYFAHLVPDVPGTVTNSTQPGFVPGRLHLCIEADRMEVADPVGGAGFEFRAHTRVAENLAPAMYRFRVFPQTEFMQNNQRCATTSLKSTAELVVPAGELVGGRSYTLVAWGSLFPDAICTIYKPGSLIRPGCVRSVEELRPHLKLIEN